MTVFVLDNSVVMRWCFENTITAYAEEVLKALSLGSEAIAPVLWLYEVGAVLSKSQRAGTTSAKQSTDFREALKVLPITVERDGADRILTDVYSIAVTHGLTGYDAAYLELALRKSLPLATLDDKLRKACLSAGVALYTPW